MKSNGAGALMEEPYKTMADSDSFKLSEGMLDAVSGGELDHMQKNDLFFAARMFKGMAYDDFDLFLQTKSHLNLSEESIAYLREIWPEA